MPLHPLVRLLQRRLGRPAAATVSARLYVKEPCGLCEEALRILAPFVHRGRLRLEQVDINSDPRLFERYCFSIPVLEVSDGTSLAWPFGQADVERVLQR